MRTTQDKLASIIERRTIDKDDCQTAISSLDLFRRESPTEPCACLLAPTVVLVMRGAKQMLIGDRAYAYDPQRFLITSIDLPVRSQVLEASPERPCVGLVFKLDLHIIAELIAQSGIQPSHPRAGEGSAAVGAVTPALLEPFGRLLALLDDPDAAAALAPLVEREIHYRLLVSEKAARLWQVVSAGSQGHCVAKALDWLKVNFAQPLRIDELAAQVRMSPSTLHHHFRLLTTMSPLQYQKWLRLSEARRLMFNERLDAASAAFHVGYGSPSQFGREYGRLFGAPPKRDIELLRSNADRPPRGRDGSTMP